jgi:1-acyl-sn-glycerol-3-phosphate acyltransferase
MQRFRKGAIKFSMGLSVPILPAVIVGAEKAWPKGETWMQSVPITVKILPQINPIDLEGLSESAYNKTLSTETKKLENKIIKTLKEIEENASSE